MAGKKMLVTSSCWRSAGMIGTRGADPIFNGCRKSVGKQERKESRESKRIRD